MPRLKVKTPSVTISSLDDADHALARIAELQRSIAGETLSLQAHIDELKTGHKAATADASAEIETLTSALCRYADDNKGSLFKNKKSVTRPFGIFGYRQSTSLGMERGYKRSQLVGLLEEAGMEEYLRIKKEADLDALRGCSPEMLSLVHARLVCKDDFFIDIPEPQTGDPAETVG